MDHASTHPALDEARASGCRGPDDCVPALASAPHAPALATPRSCLAPAPSERSSTLAIARECPVETRGVTEAGQTLSTCRGPEIRHLRGQRDVRSPVADDDGREVPRFVQSGARDTESRQILEAGDKPSRRPHPLCAARATLRSAAFAVSWLAPGPRRSRVPRLGGASLPPTKYLSRGQKQNSAAPGDARAGAGPTTRRPVPETPGLAAAWAGGPGRQKRPYGQASQRSGRRECQREVPLKASFHEWSASLVRRPWW